MVYNLTIEARRQYRENEVAKKGLYELNRLQALRRARRAGTVSDVLKERYQFTAADLPFLSAPESDADSDTPQSQSDRLSSAA
jgi:hypothetical protein